MTPVFFLAIAPLIVVIYIMFKKHSELKKQYASLLVSLDDTIIQNLIQVECETFTSGLKNRDYLFSRCDLYITRDAVIILGYNRISFIDLLSTPIILTHNTQAYSVKFPFARATKPKKLNPYSFNTEVFIEFGESGFTTTNVEIRLKEIPESMKEELKKLFPN